MSFFSTNFKTNAKKLESALRRTNPRFACLPTFYGNFYGPTRSFRQRFTFEAGAFREFASKSPSIGYEFHAEWISFQRLHIIEIFDNVYLNNLSFQIEWNIQVWQRLKRGKRTKTAYQTAGL